MFFFNFSIIFQDSEKKFLYKSTNTKKKLHLLPLVSTYFCPIWGDIGEKVLHFLGEREFSSIIYSFNLYSREFFKPKKES